MSKLTVEWNVFTQSYNQDSGRYEFDGNLPEDGQRILISIDYKGKQEVREDTWYEDGYCHLESGYDLVSEATAWLPLPEPYRRA